MEGIIRVKNSSYGRYEELLLRRDGLKKEGYQLEIEYSRVFGELIIAVFQEQIKCVKKKKTIEFCQAAANHAKSVSQKELQKFVEKETRKLRDNLDEMIEDYENSKAATQITEADKVKIKQLYHKMAKQLHPDIHPMVAESEELKSLWQSMVIAYNCNDLKLLQELEVLVSKALESVTDGQVELDIPDIEYKIAELESEIQTIIETDPYQYRFLLRDKEAVEEKKRLLEDELKQYRDYGVQLDELLNGLLASGVSIIWEMN